MLASLSQDFQTALGQFAAGMKVSTWERMGDSWEFFTFKLKDLKDEHHLVETGNSFAKVRLFPRSPFLQMKDDVRRELNSPPCVVHRPRVSMNASFSN